MNKYKETYKDVTAMMVSITDNKHRNNTDIRPTMEKGCEDEKENEERVSEMVMDGV